MAAFTGVQVLEGLAPLIVDSIHSRRRVAIEILDGIVCSRYPNTFLVLKSAQKSVIVRVSPDGQELIQVREELQAAGVRPKNKEQAMLLSTLLDDDVPVQIIAGKAGSGKTILSLAAAMQKIEDGVYNRIILTRPMSQVGKYDLGILPGTIEEKFAPFLMNYASNVEQLIGDPGQEERRKSGRTKPEEAQGGLRGVMRDFFQQYRVEMIPLQLMRGASFHKSFIIADEIQVLPHHEMLTIGSRVAEGSKLVLMGDLDQRDEKIARTATGLYKCIHDERMKKSGLTSFIELQKVVRGPVAELFADVFENKD